ncbi:MAG: YicC family protein [Clostridia bacterium]|nr:YicC family protein [Clostridia bacterium]
MVSSMTGYGRGEAVKENISVVVELRSVNHRYFEFSSRVPRGYAFLEDKLKTFCQQRITRGKVDLFLTLDVSAADNVAVEINHSLASGYVNAIKELSETYEINDGLSAINLSRFPDLFTVKSQAIDEDTVWSVVEEATSVALDGFAAMRAKEGKKLYDDVKSRVETILEKVAFVEERSPETVRAYREKLETRIREMLADAMVDEGRLLTETAIFADKVAVAEETVRLRSHIKQLMELLESDIAVGRKLDFIVQEMNREANTIGSKAQDIEIAHTVVDIKAEIEKIREQIQNIE